MTAQPDIVVTAFATMLADVTRLLTKVQAVTPAEARTTHAGFFKSEAEVFAARAEICREAADAMQRVADAMRGKLGEVAA